MILADNLLLLSLTNWQFIEEAEDLAEIERQGKEAERQRVERLAGRLRAMGVNLNEI